jgi:hypothetical protein
MNQKAVHLARLLVALCEIILPLAEDKLGLLRTERLKMINDGALSTWAEPSSRNEATKMK